MSSPQPDGFTYETKKLLWKNMGITMRTQLRTNVVNCLIDNIVPYELYNVHIVAGERGSRLEKASDAPCFVMILDWTEETSWRLWEFFENRVIVKTRGQSCPSASDPQGKVYNVSGPPQELMSQFLAFTLSRPGTKIMRLSIKGFSNIKIANTLTVEELYLDAGHLPSTGQEVVNDNNLTILEKIQKPLPKLYIYREDTLAELVGYDLIQTAERVYLWYRVISHRLLFMFKWPVIFFSENFDDNWSITHESKIFEFINDYAQQNRQVGHYFQIDLDLKTADFIIDSLPDHYATAGWKAKFYEKRKCATLLKNNFEITVFYKHAKGCYTNSLDFVVQFMELGTAKSREALGGPMHLSRVEIEAIVKYMDFHQKLKIINMNPWRTDLFHETSFFIDELIVDCETATVPSFFVDGIPVRHNDVLRIFQNNSTVRHLQIKGVYVPDVEIFCSITVLNLTLETEEEYPADFYYYLAAPEHTKGTLRVKNRQILKHANPIINSYDLEIEDEEIEDDESTYSCMSCSIM